jgi:PAS domain S-box-containing protein
LRGEQVKGTEYTFKRLDGSFFPAIVTSSVIYRKDKPVGLRGAIMDITERKRAEDEIRRSEEKYRLLFDNASEAILVIQGETIKFANPAAKVISGYTVEALRVKSFTEFIHPDDRDIVHEYYRERIAGQRVPSDYTFRIKTHDGSIKWVAIHAALIDWEGSPATLNFLSDVTKQKMAEEALRESEEKYRTLFEHLQDAILLARPDGSIIEANKAACEMFGRSVDELRAVGRKAIVDETDPRLKAALEERARMGHAQAEITMIRANGEKFIADVTSTIFTDMNGQQKTSMIIRDITEKKKAEEALLESENRYRSVFENHAAIKFLINPNDGSIVEANAAAVNYYGWSHDQLTKMKIQEINTLSPGQFNQEMEKALTSKQPHFEFRHRRADGSIRDVEVFRSNIDLKGRTLTHSIVHDITERKKAENALRNSEARFRSYFELPLIGIAITSPEKAWLEGNDRLSVILGYPWQELKDMSWSDLTYPDDLAADVEQFNRVLAGEIDSYMLEKRFIRKSGEVIWTSLAAGCVRKQDGAVDYLVALVEDITDRKESVERLRNSLVATIQAMAVTVETRDPYTAGHQRRVAALALSIAAEMDLTSEQIEGVHMAAVIHDIGKLSVPAEILSMPRRLTDIEFTLIKTHSQAGYSILKDIEFPWPVARMVFEHHERVDGSGYPQGLTGDNIIVESKVLAVADVVEAMASHRPYRPALGIDVALNEISKNRGKYYDPDVVDATLRLFHDKQYELVA